MHRTSEQIDSNNRENHLYKCSSTLGSEPQQGCEASVVGSLQFMGMKNEKDYYTRPLEVKEEAFGVPLQVPGDSVPVLFSFLAIVLK